MKFNTKVIHGGQSLDESTGAVMPPIYQTSTYGQEVPGKHKGYVYSRVSNPTRIALEKSIACLENGTKGFAFASGLAATDAILKLLNPEDEVISCNDIYGGTYRMFNEIYSKYGISFHFVDMNDHESVTKKISSKTKLFWIESPTNPLLKIIDIAYIVEIAKKINALVVVDNTFASPFLQTPLKLGAHIVLHSGTKYLGGHSDVIIGAIVVNNKDLEEKIFFQQYAGGGIAGPMDSFLTLRGIKTLHIRMQRQCFNAMEISKFLSNHDKVSYVYYPGLENHVNHLLAKRQMKDFGAMLSFRLKDTRKSTCFNFFKQLKVFTLAESLGGVESLANHPASMTHASLGEKIRIKNGITDDLVRLSVGIEDKDDLLNDLQQALK